MKYVDVLKIVFLKLNVHVSKQESISGEQLVLVLADKGTCNNFNPIHLLNAEKLKALNERAPSTSKLPPSTT